MVVAAVAVVVVVVAAAVVMEAIGRVVALAEACPRLPMPRLQEQPAAHKRCKHPQRSSTLVSWRRTQAKLVASAHTAASGRR
eukprot:1373814-Prymnesium_polylepis.1